MNLILFPCLIEVTLVSVALAVGVAWCIGLLVTSSFFIGLFYGGYYHDGAENTRKRHWPAFTSLFNRLVTILDVYFHYKITYQDENTMEQVYQALQHPHENAIFAGHPHGLFAISSLLLVTHLPHERYRVIWSRVVPCIHRLVFYVPVLREIALWMGAVDVTRENISAMLQQGHSVYLVPGGTAEMILDPQQDIQDRHTGFLKLAYQRKKRVFPIVHFGQEKAFVSYSCPGLDFVRHCMRRLLYYPFPTLFLGPFRVPLETCVLRPINPADYMGRSETGQEGFIKDYFDRVSKFYAEKKNENK